MAPPLVARAAGFEGRPALVTPTGVHTYRDLDDASHRVATGLLDGRNDLREARICFLVPPSFEYAAVQWGIWRAGGVAVPLAVSHPAAELSHIVRDAGPEAVVADPELAGRLEAAVTAAGTRLILTPALQAGGTRPLPDLEPDRRAMMVYTSGTTGRPKGVVTTHANLVAQITSLTLAWEWSPEDRTLLVLPLHHVHGIVNVLGCALWSGAVCEIQPRFEPEAAWDRLASGELTVFMAVPTIYGKLIASWDAAAESVREARSRGSRRLRLMVSGSAALPVRTLERWKEITGHVLLERYGMTEIGMALSNPLRGERRPGSVGSPLPGVEVRLVDESGGEVPAGMPGEIEVRGPAVFLEYWSQPEATRAAFHDGWFRTGDLARVEGGRYRILGRSSIDIIKTGGYKVSALEIEDQLRDHPAVAECAVVGVPDPEWGERISAAVELAPGAELSLDALQAWARERLAPYKLPRALRCVGSLPRNALGKIVKPEVWRLFDVES
ncbi:MAG TPA: acyl-CoA synthetase [Gemmatimonadales bacterium]|nr:acyl-CoA synthetase [Gemmatimonadales bacterium]